MPQTTTSSDRLSEYERAVCYYTIPQVAGPVTFGIIIMYGLCLLETMAALAYGVWFSDTTWLMMGAWTFGGMILFGIIVFFVRALAQDLRIRYALAVARRSPPAYVGADIPDPFADHVLLKKPLPASEGLYAFTDDSGHIRYYVETRQKYRYWRIQQTPDEPYCDVMVLEGVRSFTFFPRGRARPSRIGVYRENRLIAEVSCRFGWMQSEIIIAGAQAADAGYRLRQGGLYHHDRLVGRIYRLRSAYYLDIEAAHFSEGVLAAFLVMF